MPEDPTAGQVAVWQASRRAYHQRYAVPVEGVGLRAAGRATASISAELGLTRSAVRPAALDLAALRLITPFLADVPAWRTGRDDGHPDSQIAQLYDTPEHLVRIALDGWPPTHPTPGSIEQDALRLWRNGAELGDIATSVGVSADTLRQWLREGSLHLSPTRITAIEVTQRFGWSRSLNRKYRLDGVLPEPDGGSRTRPWWWEETIARVAGTSLRHRCSHCGARMASAKGRAMHENTRHT
ncbi:hypothetical protein [Janibacter melonis]|uniref:hypothetical protein n=1 Tax=Janibacter melonis TaxID=262209 RepID=UPI00191AC8D2|nr:hypothetical protein [Janibacter melonis]